MTTQTAEQHNARRQPGEVGITDDARPFSARARRLSSPRELRLLEALLDGPVSREALDRGIGASNSPDVVYRLRQKGFDLPCERRKGIDRDGRPCRFGVYRLSDDDARRAAEVQAGRGAR